MVSPLLSCSYYAPEATGFPAVRQALATGRWEMRVKWLCWQERGEEEEEPGSKGGRGTSSRLTHVAALLIPQAQPGHFAAPPEGVEIELRSGEPSVLTISQTPGAS